MLFIRFITFVVVVVLVSSVVVIVFAWLSHEPPTTEAPKHGIIAKRFHYPPKMK